MARWLAALGAAVAVFGLGLWLFHFATFSWLPTASSDRWAVATAFAAVISGSVGAAVNGWAGRERIPGAPQEALATPSERHESRPGLSTWPDPDSVQTAEEHLAALTRTWIRAGKPSLETISERTGGHLTIPDGERLLGHYWYNHENSPELVQLFLEGCHVPEELIRAWKAASKRAVQDERKGARVAQSLASVFLSLIGGTLWFFVGTGFSANSTSLHLGAGNEWAFAVSIAVTAIASLWIAFYAFVIGGEASSIPLLIPILCIVGLLVGWHEVKYFGSGLTRVGPDIRTWLSWRA